jgi:hypothetical protein
MRTSVVGIGLPMSACLQASRDAFRFLTTMRKGSQLIRQSWQEEDCLVARPSIIQNAHFDACDSIKEGRQLITLSSRHESEVLFCRPRGLQRTSRPMERLGRCR